MGFRTVFVKNGDRLNLKLDNLEVTKSTETFTIPLFDIENIILEGDYTVITSRLLAKLAQFHISVIVCDNHYLPCGQFLGFGQYHRSAVFCKTFLHNIAAINYTILHLKDSFSYLCLDSAFFSRKLSPVKLNM